MGKIAQADFEEMSGRLRRRAMGLIQQLDATTGYREQIERELAALVPRSPARPAPDAATARRPCAPAAARPTTPTRASANNAAHRSRS